MGSWTPTALFETPISSYVETSFLQEFDTESLDELDQSELEESSSLGVASCPSHSANVQGATYDLLDSGTTSDPQGNGGTTTVDGATFYVDSPLVKPLHKDEFSVPNCPD